MHVAVHLLAYAVAGESVVEWAHYHWLLESNIHSQPGFAIVAINNTDTYISPVAQVLSVIATGLHRGNSSCGTFG